MVGELLVTAFVSSGTGYLLHLTGETTTNPAGEIADDPVLRRVFEEDFLSTDNYASFNVIGIHGASVVEVHVAPEDTEITDYQPDEGVIRAYAVPLTIPEARQFGLFGDRRDGQFFEIEPGTYHVMAEARFLQKEELPPYAEAFPELNYYLEKEWDSPELRDEAPELWRLTFIPTNEPTEAVELYRELSLRERRQRGLE